MRAAVKSKELTKTLFPYVKSVWGVGPWNIPTLSCVTVLETIPLLGVQPWFCRCISTNGCYLCPGSLWHSSSRDETVCHKDQATRYIWAADSNDRPDWLQCSIKLSVFDPAEGCRVGEGGSGPGSLSASLVMGTNDGECSPADLAHSHLPRAESRDVLLAWVWCSSEWNLSKPVWNIQWVCKCLCLEGIFDFNDCSRTDARESIIFFPTFLNNFVQWGKKARIQLTLFQCNVESLFNYLFIHQEMFLW